MSGGVRPIPAEQRFWPKVRKTDGCWEWIAGLGNTGYGHFRDGNGRQVKAHRFSFELLVGPIPEGLHLDHLCRNRACVNPDHLEPVTCAENIYRGVSPAAVNHAKTHCQRGHELAGDNLITNWRGNRICRTCKNTDGAQRLRDITARKRAANGGVLPRRLQTHCKRGHEFTPENTYQAPRGRECRACKRRRKRLEWEASKKGSAA